MATDAKKQTETAISIVNEDTKQEEKDQNESKSLNSNDLGPKCPCGEIMSKTEASSKKCDGCAFYFGQNSTDECYSCPKATDCPKAKAGCTYELCITCAEFVQNCNDDSIEDIHDRDKLYFIYNGNKIHGPMTMRDIITYYVTKKIKTTKMYVMKADPHDKWTKLEFPANIYDKLEYNDKKRCNKMTECEKINCEIKKKHPDLYARLIEHILCSKLRQVCAPKEIPKDEQIVSNLSFKHLTRILGKILSIFLAAILIIHALPTAIIGCIVLCIYLSLPTDEERRAFWPIICATGYSGIIITPILVVHFMVNKSDLYDEIQSWMISYIIWGALSYLTSLIYFIFWAIGFEDFNDKLNNIVLMIIGVNINSNDDFGDVADSELTVYSVVFMFSSLANLLPAAIAGFIANFALEEKFELKCGANITSDICFESDYGCCDVVSSHDYRNSYAFIGGLASNILATWAVIRICGYL
eukprot:264226_1